MAPEAWDPLSSLRHETAQSLCFCLLLATSDICAMCAPRFSIPLRWWSSVRVCPHILHKFCKLPGHFLQIFTNSRIKGRQIAKMCALLVVEILSASRKVCDQRCKLQRINLSKRWSNKTSDFSSSVPPPTAYQYGYAPLLPPPRESRSRKGQASGKGFG